MFMKPVLNLVSSVRSVHENTSTSYNLRKQTLEVVFYKEHMYEHVTEFLSGMFPLSKSYLNCRSVWGISWTEVLPLLL